MIHEDFRRLNVSRPEVLQFFIRRDLQGKTPAECVILNTGKFTQSQMNMLRTDADSLVSIDRERSGIEGGQSNVILLGKSFF